MYIILNTLLLASILFVYFTPLSILTVAYISRCLEITRILKFEVKPLFGLNINFDNIYKRKILVVGVLPSPLMNTLYS